MAVTHFAFGLLASDHPGMISRSATCEAVAVTGTTAATTATAPTTSATKPPVCRVATDTAVYVSFGTAPNASTDTIKFYVPAGTTEYFFVSSGDKAAAVTA